jgi:hypothetical protein
MVWKTKDWSVAWSRALKSVSSKIIRSGIGVPLQTGRLEAHSSFLNFNFKFQFRININFASSVQEGNDYT